MIEMTEHEVTEAYASLKRAIRRGDERSAAQMVQSLLPSLNSAEVWKFLLMAASSEVSYTDHQTAMFVRVLFDNWTLHKNSVFAVHAVLALTSAPKGTSAMDYISRRTD